MTNAQVHTTILVSLQHELCMSSVWIPELHAAILRSRHDPLSIWGKRNTENEILVTFESADALALAARATVVRVELPHPDRLV